MSITTFIILYNLSSKKTVSRDQFMTFASFVDAICQSLATDNHRTHTSFPIKEAIHDLTHDSQLLDEGIGKDAPEGKQTSIIPSAQLVRSPSIHCKGCKCHETDKLSESFEKNAKINESPVRSHSIFPDHWTHRL